jgi:hypothetical protein
VIGRQQRNNVNFVFGATPVNGEIIGRTIEWTKAVQQAGL